MLVILAGALRSITIRISRWHLKTGEHIVETEGFLCRHLLHHFPGARVGNARMAFRSIIYEIYRVLGIGGLTLVFSLIITAGFWIVYQRSARRAGHPYIPGFALILGGLTAAPTWACDHKCFRSFLPASMSPYWAIMLKDEKSRARCGGWLP